MNRVVEKRKKIFLFIYFHVVSQSVAEQIDIIKLFTKIEFESFKHFKKKRESVCMSVKEGKKDRLNLKSNFISHTKTPSHSKGLSRCA